MGRDVFVGIVGILVGTDIVNRQVDVHAAEVCFFDNILGHGYHILFQQGISYFHAHRMEERVAHSTRNNQVVNLFQQMCNNIQFGGNLATANDCRKRASSIVEHQIQIGSLFIKQVAGIALAREETGNGGGGSMFTVRCAESVIHIQISQTGNLSGEILITGLLFIMETEILQQSHTSGLQRGNPLFRLRIQHNTQEMHFRAQHFTGFRHNVTEGELVAGYPFRASQVRHQDGHTTGCGDLFHRIHRAYNTGCICHLQIFVQRHIVINSH